MPPGADRPEPSPAAGRRYPWPRAERLVHNRIALAIARDQRLEVAPQAGPPVVSDPLERSQLADQMAQDSRDAQFYAEEGMLHLLAGRDPLARQSAEIWQRIRQRMNRARDSLVAVAPPPDLPAPPTYWTELEDGVAYFELDWDVGPRDEAELDLYRWVQLERSRAALMDEPVWEEKKGSLQLRANVQRAHPRLPEALASIAARLAPEPPRGARLPDLATVRPLGRHGVG